MPRKKKKKTGAVPKSGPVWRRTAEQATLDRMPKYNAHACGTGAHGDAKYNRAKQDRRWKRENEREARDRGPSLFQPIPAPFMQPQWDNSPVQIGRTRRRPK